MAHPIRLFRDASRLGTGLIVNGRTVPVRATCICGGAMFVQRELEEGCCVDCSIVAQREMAEDAQRDRDAAAEPIQDTLGGGW